MKPGSQPLARGERALLAGLFAGGLALRLLHVFSQRSDVLFDHPVIDEETYVRMARTLASGQDLEPAAWMQPPGLVYALEVVFKIAGPGLLAPRVAQAVISSACSLLAFAVARRLFTKRIALATAAVCALHGVLVFESYELLPPTWILAADLSALWILLVAAERRTLETTLAAGVALGVSAVFAATVLPFVLVAAFALRRASLVAALLVGVAIPIAPVTWDNWDRGHELALVSTNGGLNFFLGNNEHYESTLALRPGRNWQELLDEPHQAGVPGSGSSYFLARSLAFERAHPARGAALYLRKLYLYFDGAEIPRDTDLYAARDASPVLRELVWGGPPWLPDGALIPLALVGVVASFRARRRLLVAYGFLASQALVIAAFFVTSRYRVPAIPVLAMFAGAGVGAIRDAWRGARGARRAAPLLACAALAVVLDLPTWETRTSYAAELDFYRGLAYLRDVRSPHDAVPPFERAAARDPGDARVWFELGNALQQDRRPREAIAAWTRAAALDPSDGRPRRLVANAYLELALEEAKSGDFGRARDDLRTAAPYLTAVKGLVEDWTRAALRAPGLSDEGFWRDVGDVLAGLGDDELAGTAWRRASESR